MSAWSKLIGTVLSAFKIGLANPATLDAGGLSAPRTFTLPDSAGTFTVQGTIGNFVASGSSHAAGLVPDPGSTAASAKYLREDATWALPAAGAGGSDKQIQFNNSSGLAGSSNLVYDYNAAILHLFNTDIYSGRIDFINTASPNLALVIFNGGAGVQAFNIYDTAGNPIMRCDLSGATIGWFSSAGVVQQAANQALTDSTGGTASTTLAAVSGSGDDTHINNNFASLAARLAEIRTLLTAYGLGS